MPVSKPRKVPGNSKAALGGEEGREVMKTEMSKILKFTKGVNWEMPETASNFREVSTPEKNSHERMLPYLEE